MTTEAIAKQLAEQVKAAIATRDATIEALEARLKAVEDRPLPKDGRDGVDGKDGAKGDPGDNVAAMEAISEVRSKIKALEERPAPRDGRDGQPGQKGDPGDKGFDGRDGADGWSPDHVEMTIDDEGQWEFKMVTGDKVKSFTGRIPVNVDRGVFSNEASYAKGHMVTYGGDVWVCKEDNPGPPGKDFAGWRLAVRKGRDAPRAKV
jgi:hypothetical protein